MRKTNKKIIGGLAAAALTVGALGLASPAMAADSPSDQGTVNVTVESVITLTLEDDVVDLEGLSGSAAGILNAGANGETDTMRYTVKTNNFSGYAVTVASDTASLTGATNGNSDVIDFDELDVTNAKTGANADATVTNKSAVALGTTGAEIASSTARSGNWTDGGSNARDDDEFTLKFNLADVPWVNADTYTGTVTLTATANQ